MLFYLQNCGRKRSATEGSSKDALAAPPPTASHPQHPPTAPTHSTQSHISDTALKMVLHHWCSPQSTFFIYPLSHLRWPLSFPLHQSDTQTERTLHPG